MVTIDQDSSSSTTSFSLSAAIVPAGVEDPIAAGRVISQLTTVAGDPYLVVGGRVLPEERHRYFVFPQVDVEGSRPTLIAAASTPSWATSSATPSSTAARLSGWTSQPPPSGSRSRSRSETQAKALPRTAWLTCSTASTQFAGVPALRPVWARHGPTAAGLDATPDRSGGPGHGHRRACGRRDQEARRRSISAISASWVSMMVWASSLASGNSPASSSFSAITTAPTW